MTVMTGYCAYITGRESVWDSALFHNVESLFDGENLKEVGNWARAIFMAATKVEEGSRGLLGLGRRLRTKVPMEFIQIVTNMEGGRRPEWPQPSLSWDDPVFTGGDLKYSDVVKILAEGEGEEAEEWPEIVPLSI